jgi:hypothetical protein
LAINSKLGKKIRALVNGKPLLDSTTAQPGDVFFHCEDDSVGHTNMICQDTTKKVDSVDGAGVRTMPLTKDRHACIVFRFHDATIARNATLLATSWADQVNYSGGPSAGIGITGRVIGAVMGSSNFGLGAKARLLKYRSRAGQQPKNVICSEMCILAYQLCMVETDAAFIKLDAKHSIPSTLFKYFLNQGKSYWKVAAYK